MKPLSVIIPSRTASNLVPCIAAVRQHEPTARIIVVDDGVAWDEYMAAVEEKEPKDYGLSVTILPGVKPFVFSRNANIGIRAAGDADVVLLNDDALLESPGGFSLMQQAAEEHPEVGLVGAVTDSTGSIQQWRRKRRLEMDPDTKAISASNVEQIGFRIVDHIAFVCVLIPWRTRTHIQGIDGNCEATPEFDHVFTGGFLDERYVTYGWEDNDYIRQCKTAGLQIAVHDGCYVNHSKLPSTFRGKGGPGGDIEPGRKIYMAKWPGFRQ